MAKLLKTLLLKTASIAINTQLVLSPMALSINSAVAQDTAWDKASKAVDALTKGVQIGTQVLNQTNSAGPNNQYLIKPVAADGLHQKLANNGCMVLEAKGNSLAVDSICDESNPDVKDQAMVLQYLETAQINKETVDEFIIKGNDRFSQGPACFDRVALTYQQELKAKLKSLDDLKSLMENKIKAFKVQSDKLVTAIKGDDAILNGAGEVALANHNFMANFTAAERNSCATFITENTIQENGKSSGLRGLKSIMDRRFEGEDSNGDSYSPKQVLTNQRQITKDVESLLENFNNNITGTDSIALDSDTLYDGAQATLFDVQNRGVSNILGNELKDFERTLRDKKKQFRGLDEATASRIESIENGTENSADIAEIYKRNQYNACIAEYVGNSSTFSRSITNYSLSDSANNNRDSILRTTVYENLEDNDIDIDQKIKNISAYDSSSQEKIRLSRTQTLCGKTIYKDATNISVSSLLSLYRCECEKIYNSKDGGTISQKDTETKLAGYTKYIADEKNKLMSNIATKVKEKVLYCNEDQTTGIGALSCENAFDRNSNNFCLKTATTCASNVASCGTSIANALDATVASQINKAKIYETEMEVMKQELFATLQNALTISQIDSLNEDAINQTGSLSKSTTDLKLDLVQNKFLEGLDQELKIEDPDAYLELFQNDIAKIREDLKKSLDEQFGEDVENFSGYASKSSSTQGLLGVISTAMSNANLEKARWSTIYEKCKRANAAIIRQINDANQQQQEYDQKIAEQNAYNLKKCQILIKGCDDSAHYSLLSNTAQITEAINGSSLGNPADELCSNDDIDPSEFAAKMMDKKNLTLQIIKIKEYCASNDTGKNDYSNECKNTGSFCKSYKDEDRYNDVEFCVEYGTSKDKKNKIIEVISNNISCSKTVDYATLKRQVDNDRILRIALDDYKDKRKCITPEDDDYKDLAFDAYKYSANSSTFTGLGEQGAPQECKNIIAASKGSGDKDEGLNNFTSGFFDILNGANVKGQ